MQLQYWTAIEEKFQKHISDVYKKLGGLPLSVAVDVRFDSPGFCASRSTAVFMDSNTKAIIHMEKHNFFVEIRTLQAPAAQLGHLAF
uniref:Uncharacterized protein n=1 Tax=Magallana gigas TaxID=29159 RepID=A0A8W8LR70_MAGGI